MNFFAALREKTFPLICHTYGFYTQRAQENQYQINSPAPLRLNILTMS